MLKSVDHSTIFIQAILEIDLETLNLVDNNTFFIQAILEIDLKTLKIIIRPQFVKVSRQ